MREFVNDFETLLNNITWGDGAIAAAFRSKLLPWILSRIVTGDFPKLPDSYTAYKEAALQAESNIALMDAQKQKTHQEGPPRKRQRTDTRQASSASMTPIGERQNPQMALRRGRLTQEERERRGKHNLC